MPHHSPSLITATEGSGTINAANGLSFTFTSPIAKLMICNDSDYKLVVKLNAAVANQSGDDWTFVVQPESTFTFSDQHYTITSVAVYAETALVYQTDYQISGFAWWE